MNWDLGLIGIAWLVGVMVLLVLVKPSPKA